jgi:hypothetical protein
LSTVLKYKVKPIRLLREKKDELMLTDTMVYKQFDSFKSLDRFLQ